MLTVIIDLKLSLEIFWLNFGMFLRLLVMSYIFFYVIPKRVFPQGIFPEQSIENKLYNIFMMIAYVELVVPLMILIKIYSLFLFLVTLFITKLLILKYYDKKEIWPWIENLYHGAFIKIMDFFDRYDTGQLEFKRPFKERLRKFSQRVTPFKVARGLLITAVFGYAIFTFMYIEYSSLADAVPDVSQYIQWISYLGKEVLFSDYFQSSANFYGPPIFVFFLKSISNVDLVLLPRVFPVFLMSLLYFSLFYVVFRTYKSLYAGLFALMMLSLIFYTPLAGYFVGEYVITSHPILVEILGMKFYTSDPKFFWQITEGNEMLAWKPIERFMGGLGFEYSVSFYSLNLYFFVQVFKTKENRWLLMYGLTLFFVFLFHSGLAVYLVIASIFILVHTIFFRYLTVKLFFKGLGVILLAAIIGSLWLFSILEFGMFSSIGAALPIFDVLFETEQSIKVVTTKSVDLMEFNIIHFIFLVLTVLTYVAYLLIPKHRYERSALLLSIPSIYFIFFATNLGLPTIVAPARTVELYLLNLAMLTGAMFALLVIYPLRRIAKRHTQKILVAFLGILFVILAGSMPKWYNTKRFYAYIDRIGYSASSYLIYELSRTLLPFSWTLVDWVQESPKVAETGYHLNIFNLITEYDPTSTYLTIPTRYVFIVVQKHPNRYRGMGEWFYRWRKRLYHQLRSWIALYKTTHDNLRLYKSTPNIDVYVIDNKAYLDYLEEERLKKLARSKK